MSDAATQVKICGITRLDDAELAVELTSDIESRAFALVVRGLVLTYSGDREGSVRDCAEATALARGLGPGALAGALHYQAQAQMLSGDLDGAAKQLQEAASIGATVDAKTLCHQDTLTGDLAVLTKEYAVALEHYARSLEAAQARGDQLQIYHDLWSVADVLAVLHDDAAALEIAGLAEAQTQDMRGPAAVGSHYGLGDAIGAAHDRTGATLASELKARGRAVPAGNRVTVACRRAPRGHSVRTGAIDAFRTGRAGSPQARR